jgi:outer membrane murein-binding lipoprotein Lpp
MLSVGKGKSARLIFVIIALIGIGLVLTGCGNSKKLKDLQTSLDTATASVTKLTADLKTATDAKTASDKAATDAKTQVTTLQTQLKAYDITAFVATWTTALANGGKVELVVAKTGAVTVKAKNAAGEATTTANGGAGLLPNGEFTVHAGNVYMTFTVAGADLKLASVVGSDQLGAAGAVFKK